LILHLPIKVSDINNHTNPLPNMKNEMNYSIYNEQNNTYKVNELNLLQTQDNFLKNNDISTTMVFNDKENNESFYNSNDNLKNNNYIK